MNFKYWLNVDKTGKLGTLHSSLCSFRLLQETPFKGIERNKIDGGWFSFQSTFQAKEWLPKNFPHYQYQECSHCIHS
ncbi:hypothetical protein [Bacillus sp. 165]|uniref:hypothetical protein n=1 Tax=Bacillus sp. 165 TaxID=1529117 RepID=UPI001AD99912|nr:hypothetical protein [Bacillus sp. 165]MBO9130385.1 hypothetical protein [Bacillus sp. 165]